MKIETKRLILRDYVDSDKKWLLKHLNNKKIATYMAVMPYPYSSKMAEEYLSKRKEDINNKKRTSYSFAVVLRETGEFVGGISLNNVNYSSAICSIGYWLKEELWGRGYMSEAVFAIIDFGFSKLKLRRIELTCNEGNKGSRAIAEKFGFKLEGILRKAHYVVSSGKISNKCYYGLLKEEWPAVKRRLK